MTGRNLAGIVARREGGVPCRPVGRCARGGRQGLAPEAAWHTLSAEEVLRAEAATRGRPELGGGGVAGRPVRPQCARRRQGRASLARVIRQYSDPMQIVLLVVGGLSLFPLRQLGTGPLLILLTLANAVLGLQQEGGAESAVAVLQRRLIVPAGCGAMVRRRRCPLHSWSPRCRLDRGG